MVNRRDVEPKLPQMIFAELRSLDFHNDIPIEIHVEEKQVHEPLLRSDLQTEFPADKHEALSKLQQELLNVRHHRVLEFLLAILRRQRNEVKTVGILRDLLREVAVRLWECNGEVRNRLTLPFVKLRV